MSTARIAALIALTAHAAPAQAHLVETGFGAFYDGFAHVTVTPSDLLLILGLALYAGQRGTQAARPALFALPLAWLAGGLLAAVVPSDASLAVLTTLSFGVAGALAALNARLPTGAVLVLVLGTGLLHGYVNGASTDAGRPLALAGTTTAAFCLFAIVAAQTTALRQGWTAIAVRVGGSWIAAAGLLTLGWIARG
jgi:hydrogenase/urease accessory protein HupE